MPTELEELVEFIHHGNTPIRQLAVENLVPYSLSQPSIFKTNQLLPIRDLKLLVRDYAPIAKNALTMLINLSTDREVLECLAADDQFLETLLARVTNPVEPNANLIAMLFTNLAKWDGLKRLFTLERSVPKDLGSNQIAINQVLDLFVKGADGTYNKSADFDYLSYLFADLAKHPEGRLYFTTKQAYDAVIPLTKLTVFTEHPSSIRRKGVASTIKNVAFDIPSHPSFLSSSPNDINVLPYVLLPLTGNEDYDLEDMEAMLPDLQLLPPDKKRDADPGILQTHIETLMLLTTTRSGRDRLRDIKVYPVIRETHLRVEDEGLREACERLVQVLMRDEEGEEGRADGGGMMALERVEKRGHEATSTAVGTGSWTRAEEAENGEEEDEDDQIVEV